MRLPVLVPLLLLLGGCAGAEGPAPDPRETVEAAQQAIAADRPGEALAPLGALLDHSPDDALARAALAHALLLTGDLEGSIVQGKLAVGIDPALAEASWNLACAYTKAGDFDAAVAWLQRAVIAGEFDGDDVTADPDLAPLVDDHRVAVFLAAGVLSRAEEDVLTSVDRPRLTVGETLELSIALIQLNRGLLSEGAARLDPGQDQSLAWFQITERTETFTRGEAGGREYAQRSVRFRLVARAPGPWLLGPFRVEGEDGVHWTDPMPVLVEGDAPEPIPRAPTAFALPSVADPALLGELAPGDDAWEPGTPLPGELPRAARFLVGSLDALPELPPRPPNSVRSTFLQRRTEGPSWFVDRAD